MTVALASADIECFRGYGHAPVLCPLIELRPHVEQPIPRRPIQRGLLRHSLQPPRPPGSQPFQ